MFESILTNAMSALCRFFVLRDVDAFDGRLCLRRALEGSDRWRGARRHVRRRRGQIRVLWIGYGFVAGHWASARWKGPG
jgi:hypothetical protein